MKTRVAITQFTFKGKTVQNKTPTPCTAEERLSSDRAFVEKLTGDKDLLDKYVQDVLKDGKPNIYGLTHMDLGILNIEED